MSALTTLAGLGWTLVAMFLGFGLPLGMPPEKADPAMAYAAPKECLYYSSWAGTAAPDAASSNRTEQLLAEPEVRAFAAALERALASAAAGQAASSADPARATRLAKSVPLWTRTLLTRPTAIYLAKFNPQGNRPDIEAGLIVRADDAAGALHAALTEALTSEATKPAEATIAGRKFLTLAEPIELTWGITDGYLLIGVGPGAVEGLMSRLAAKQEPGWLTQLKTNLPIERRASVAYLNVKLVFDTFAPLGGPQVEGFLAALGLRQITSFQSSTGLDGNGVVNRSLLAYSGVPRGLLTLAERPGLTATDLAHIPADSLAATCLSLDARQLIDALLAALAEVDPQAGASAEDGLAQLGEQAGIDIRAMLSALGGRWSLHAAPADGGWLGAAVLVDVRDRQQLLQAQDRLVEKFLAPGRPETNLPEAPGQLVRTQFAGHTIMHWDPRGAELAFLMPSWCVTDKHIVFGLNPQAVKSVLLRQSGGKSLADLPEVAALLKGKDPILAISYSDTPKMFEAVYPLAQVLLPMAAANLRREGVPLDFDAGQLPAPSTIGKHLRPGVSCVRRTKLGLEMESRQSLPGISLGASAPVAVALLLPAVQASREAASRMSGANNLKHQLLALHNFHDVNGGFPAAWSTDKDGKPLLSWRVAILPYIEEQALYNEFHLDEPWDSEHNKKLLARMPRVFRSPNSKAAAGLTTYLGVGGKQGVLAAPADPKNPAAANGVRLADITDGTSNTITIVEASDTVAVEWTKPVEWVPDEKKPLTGLIGLRPNGFNAALADGSVRFISQNVDVGVLQRLFMRNDGLPVP